MEDNNYKLVLEKYRCLWKIMKHKYIEKEYKSNIYGQGKLLKTLIINDECLSQKDLVKILNISPPSLSELVNKCVKNEYVEKIKDQDDLRLTYIKVTDKGKELIRKKEEIKPNVAGDIFSCLTNEELKSFEKILDKIKDYIKKDGE